MCKSDVTDIFTHELFSGAALQLLFTTEGRVANKPTAHGLGMGHGLSQAGQSNPRYRRKGEPFRDYFIDDEDTVTEQVASFRSVLDFNLNFSRELTNICIYYNNSY